VKVKPVGSAPSAATPAKGTFAVLVTVTVVVPEAVKDIVAEPTAIGRFSMTRTSCAPIVAAVSLVCIET
jgi:hypothetical protein